MQCMAGLRAVVDHLIRQTAVMRKPTPTARRWQLGQQLKQHREAAGVRPATAAREIETSTSTLSRIESGKQMIKTGYVKLLALLYGVDDATREHLLTLAEEAGQPEWHTSLSRGMPDWFRLYLGYEAAASLIRCYGAELVDGRLQTTEYTRAIAAAAQPAAGADELTATVALRRGRQELITGEDPIALHVVMNEAVLRRVVGSPEVMRGQLEHLAEMADRPNVTVQVLPFSAGAHPAMTAPFTLLGFSDEWADMATVYLENGRGALYLEAAADLANYSWRFEECARLALSPDESRDLLVRVASDL